MMTWFVAYRTKFSVKYNALTDVVFYISLSSLVPFACPVTVYADI